MRSMSRIWKGLMMAGWISLGVGLLTLLVAAMNTKNAKQCSDVIISFTNPAEVLYTGKESIARILDENGLSVLKGKSIKNFDLKAMEDRLERDPWIHNAELFFDNNRVLRVNIEENKPIARIFTLKGNTFYIDSSLHRLPLNERYTPRLPVFTGFPGERYPWKGKDKKLMIEVKKMAQFFETDSFWMAQIDQCEINEQRNFELMPKIGDHVILFGNGNNIPERFRKLDIFYQQVLAKTGFNTYQEINVEYEGQVVATKRNNRYKISDTAQSNLWMRQWRLMTQHQVLSVAQSTLAPESKEELDLPSSKQSVPDPIKTKSSNKNPVSGKPKESGTKGALPAEKTLPKAVLPKAEKES